MKVRKLAMTDASFERTPGQHTGVFVCYMVDQHHEAPITIGLRR